MLEWVCGECDPEGFDKDYVFLKTLGKDWKMHFIKTTAAAYNLSENALSPQWESTSCFSLESCI